MSGLCTGRGLCKRRSRDRSPRQGFTFNFKRRFDEFVMKNLDDLKTKSFWRAVAAEFTASFFLILIGCGSWIETSDYPITIRIALSFGFMYAVLIYSLRHISGGHVNPTVTVAMAATCNISLARAILYIIAQTLGAILGAGVLYGLIDKTYQGNLGCTFPAEHVTEGQGFGIEFITSLILVFITFACFEEHGQDEERRCPGHLIIGLTVTALSCFAIPLTGGSFNPARSFGPAVVKGIWTKHWLYWFGTLLGGTIGGAIYDIVFSKTATLSRMINCVAGTRKTPKKDKPPPGVSTAEEGTEPERIALRARPRTDAASDGVKGNNIKDSKEQNIELNKESKPSNSSKVWCRYDDTSFAVFKKSATDINGSEQDKTVKQSNV